jgi:hypothetical protein
MEAAVIETLTFRSGPDGRNKQLGADGVVAYKVEVH